MIATAVLSAGAVAGGLALASGDRNRDRVAAEQEQQRQQQQREQQEAQPATTAPVTPRVTATGARCRPETQKMGVQAGAVGELTEVLVLRTRRSVVWICEDQAENLYYHANKGGEKAPWVEGSTALFLGGVYGEGDAYVAEAPDGVRFSVNTDRLLIIHKDGSEEEQKAS